jgi:(p)ppGpp synthase/HD superfamily hydrolase
MNILAKNITNLELKEMEGSLLSFAIMESTRNSTNFNVDKVREALELAAYLHRSDTRANRANLPRDTYITHPYRNTLRILRYGCTNHDVIVASILHDTVEDHALEIVTEFLENPTPNSSLRILMDESLAYLSDTFGPEVARIVSAVSNPPLPKTLTKVEKRALYAEHVLSVIEDPYVFLVKFSDFVDNAVGLYHNTGNPDMVNHLSQKYLQLVEAFEQRLAIEKVTRTIPVTDKGLEEMRNHLKAGKERLLGLLNNK